LFLDKLETKISKYIEKSPRISLKNHPSLL